MLPHDLRHAVRTWLGTPTVTLLAVTALALGIGATTAVFSIVNGVLVKPLPFDEPNRLTIVWEHNIPRNRDRNVVAPANYLAWRDETLAFDRLIAFSGTDVNLTGVGEPEELAGQRVGADLFSTLGVDALHGRTFLSEEGEPGAARVVLLSHGLWERRFGSDPSLVGQPIMLNGQAHVVVGIMPPGFVFFWPDRDVWIPLSFDEDDREPSGRSILVLGRLAPGVTTQQAQADMARVSTGLVERWPEFNTGWGVNVVPLQEQIVGEIKPALVVLLGAVVLVLLIACANVASLLLARGAGRQRELSIRTALGAGRRQLVRQLLTEASVLAVCGGLIGVGLAYVALDVLRMAVADTIPLPRLHEVHVDASVLAFTTIVSGVTAMLFGLVPAVQASQVDVTESLKEGGRGGVAGQGHRLRSALVVLEIALAFVLLTGAGLLVKSFGQLLAVDPGFHAESVLTFGLQLPGSTYAEDHQRVAFYEDLTQRLSNLPGVRAVGGVAFLPMNGMGSATSFHVEGLPEPERGQWPVTDVRWVTGHYFDAMGIPRLEGRTFDNRDVGDASNVVVVNETMARTFWPDTFAAGGEAGDPVGRGLFISWDRDTPERIIGVVGDVRLTNLDGDVRPTIYWPHPRVPAGFMTMVMRTASDPGRLAAAAVSQVRALDPNLPISAPRTMTDVVSDSVARPRLTMVLLGVFAAAALLLASIGIYGVMAHSVTQRTAEIGLRIALGAGAGRVLAMVLRHGGFLIGSGLALGAAGAVAITRLMTSLLFGVTPTDPPTFVVIACVLTAVALAAVYVPARRATRVDPLEALRHD